MSQGRSRPCHIPARVTAFAWALVQLSRWNFSRDQRRSEKFRRGWAPSLLVYWNSCGFSLVRVQTCRAHVHQLPHEYHFPLEEEHAGGTRLQRLWIVLQIARCQQTNGHEEGEYSGEFTVLSCSYCVGQYFIGAKSLDLSLPTVCEGESNPNHVFLWRLLREIITRLMRGLRYIAILSLSHFAGKGLRLISFLYLQSLTFACKTYVFLHISLFLADEEA